MSKEKCLTQLRDEWIAAENARTEAYRAFMDANRTSLLRRQLDDASLTERHAKEAFSSALQKSTQID